MIITLTRDMPVGLDDQYGILTVPGLVDSLQTIERPWLDDMPDKSCIPVGKYSLVPTTVNHGPLMGLRTYALRNPALGVFLDDADASSYTGKLPVRKEIKIHPANCASELEGCIAPGLSRGRLALPGCGLANAVLSSKSAFDNLISVLSPSGIFSTNHTLIIGWAQ